MTTDLYSRLIIADWIEETFGASDIAREVRDVEYKPIPPPWEEELNDILATAKEIAIREWQTSNDAWSPIEFLPLPTQILQEALEQLEFL